MASHQEFAYLIIWCFYLLDVFSEEFSISRSFMSRQNHANKSENFSALHSQAHLICWTAAAPSSFLIYILKVLKDLSSLITFSLGLDYMGSAYVIDTAESLLITISATFTDCSCSCCKFCFCSNNVNLNPLRLCCLWELSQATKV